MNELVIAKITGCNGEAINGGGRGDQRIRNLQTMAQSVTPHVSDRLVGNCIGQFDHDESLQKAFKSPLLRLVERAGQKFHFGNAADTQAKMLGLRIQKRCSFSVAARMIN